MGWTRSLLKTPYWVSFRRSEDWTRHRRVCLREKKKKKRQAPQQTCSKRNGNDTRGASSSLSEMNYVRPLYRVAPTRPFSRKPVREVLTCSIVLEWGSYDTRRCPACLASASPFHKKRAEMKKSGISQGPPAAVKAAAGKGSAAYSTSVAAATGPPSAPGAKCSTRATCKKSETQQEIGKIGSLSNWFSHPPPLSCLLCPVRLRVGGSSAFFRPSPRSSPGDARHLPRRRTSQGRPRGVTPAPAEVVQGAWASTRLLPA